VRPREPLGLVVIVGCAPVEVVDIVDIVAVMFGYGQRSDIRFDLDKGFYKVLILQVMFFSSKGRRLANKGVALRAETRRDRLGGTTS
jgi:hypothetical protein